MINQHNATIAVLFTEEAESVLLDIVKKYSLEENDDQLHESIISGKLDKITTIKQFTRDFASEKISTIDFLQGLHKELDLSKEAIKNLVKDIVTDLIPLLDKVPEDKLEEYNERKNHAFKQANKQTISSDGYNKQDFQQELLNKINANKPSPILEEESLSPLPYDKKIEITDVEENAESMTGNLTKEKPFTENAPTLKPAPKPTPENETPAQTQNPDQYREPIE